MKRIMFFMLIFLFSSPSFAELSNQGIMNDVLNRFNSAASGWSGEIESAALRIFWSLALISMVWTFGQLALKKADISEFFAEFIRFTVFTGFNLWLLTHAVKYSGLAVSIINGLSQLGVKAGGTGISTLGPSEIVDLGFSVVDLTSRAVDNLRWTQLGTIIVMWLMTIIILLVLALVAVNVMLLLAKSWIVLYAGIFFLGFGGSRWTSDMAIGYYKTILNIAAQLMTMYLLVGIGKDFVSDYAAKISPTVKIGELAVMMVVSFILLMLVSEVPKIIGNMAGGVNTGSNMSAGGMAGMVAGAISSGIAMAAGFAAAGKAAALGTAGACDALVSAVSKASDNVSSGNDALSQAMGKGSSVGAGSFADAAGFGDQQNSASSSSTSSSVNQEGGTSQSGDSGQQESFFTGTNQEDGASQGGDSSQQESSSTGANQEDGASQGGDSSQQESSSTDANQEGGANKKSISSQTAKLGKIAAETGVLLGKGLTGMAKNKAQDFYAGARQSISNTTGGKLAQAIKGQNPKQEDDNSLNTLSGEMESEIAAFRDSK